MSQPLRTLRQSVGASTLIIMLPGAYMTPEDYEKSGFFSAITKRKLPLDIVTVDLDLSRISDGTALPACWPFATTPIHRIRSMVCACSRLIRVAV